MRIVINTHGNNLIGMGHIFRQLALAEELKKKKAEILFLIKDFPEGVKKIKENRWSFTSHPSNLNPYEETKFCLKSFAKFKPEIIIVDHLNTSEIKMKAFTKTGALLVTFDDWGPGKWYADLSVDALYSKAIPKPAFSKTKILEGPKYIILRKEFEKLPPKSIKKGVKKILVTQGGADTWAVIPKIVRGLSGIDKKIKVTVILGSAFKHQVGLEEAIRTSEVSVEVKRDVKNFIEIMKQSDLAISAAGLTVFELLAVGVPTIVITGEPKELETAYRLEKKNLIVNLGWIGGPTSGGVAAEMLKLVVENTINDFRLRKSLSRNGQSLQLGLGTKRVAEMIINTLNKKK